jgi:O-antigen/teichoic acid export membrane protein
MSSPPPPGPDDSIAESPPDGGSLPDSVVEDDPAALRPKGDLTGQERLAWNVFAGWAGYLVVSLAGFVAPPVMDRKLGQVALGVWDFGWSLVTYFALTQLGVASSVNRYVAKYRAAHDVVGLRRVTSSVGALNLTASSLAFLLAALSAWALPWLLRAELTAQLPAARLLVVLLGLTVATQMFFQVHQGILAGCYRFDILNAITATVEVANSLAIVAVLLAGGGLVALGATCLLCQVAAGLMRMYWAKRICPEARIVLAEADWNEAKRLLKFGIKAFVYSLSGLLLIQANKLIVGGVLGAAALAVFSRPLALIRVIETFTHKFAYVLTPTASSLQSSGQHERLLKLLLQCARLGTALTLPMVLTLAILGDLIMLIWMGPRYAAGPLTIILALGHLGTVAMWPVTMILVGMNRHGRPAVATVTAAALSTLLGLLNAFVFGWGITGAALAVALPLLGSAAFVATYACREFGVSGWTFAKALSAPIACAVPFALILLASRALWPGQPLLAVFGGLALAGPMIVMLYWFFVIPEELKAQVFRLLARARGLAAR